MDLPTVFHPHKSNYFVITADFILPLIVIIGILALTYLVLFSPIFAISRVQCQLDYQPCLPSSMLAEIERVKGQNLVRFDSSTLSTRLTSADFTIRQAQITKTLPNILSVSLLTSYPVLALKLADLSEWIVIDEQMQVIRSLATDPNVPTVIVPGPLTVSLGEIPSDPTLISALTLARSLATAVPSVTTIRLVDQDTLDLTLPHNLHAILTPRGDIETQIASLQGILANATITEGVSVVDLRFSQPVLR